MSYVNPVDVHSPKWAVKFIRVLEDLGEGSYSVARLKYDGRDVVACRWNGDGDGEPHGHPNSRGKPTWFLLPENIARDVLSGVISRALSVSDKIKNVILRIKEDSDLLSDNVTGTKVEIYDVTELNVIEANLLVEIIKLDDDFKRKKVFVLDTDVDGYKSINPIKEVNGKRLISLVRYE